MSPSPEDGPGGGEGFQPANYQKLTIQWDGIAIEVAYNPNIFRVYQEEYGYALAHVALQVSTPDTPLPVTDTGYDSHFTRTDAIEALGGIEAYLRLRLDAEAEATGWQKGSPRQQRLF